MVICATLIFLSVEQFPNNNKEVNMKRSEYEQIQKEVIDFLEQLDEQDKKFILIDYDIEEPEPDFLWEYCHESSTEIDSVFRFVPADSDYK